MSKQTEETKHRICWFIGVFLSSILYFSGIVSLYVCFRKKVLRRYRNIVLTYHRITDDSKDGDISVSTANFESEMAYLKRHFNVTSLETLINNVGKNLKKPMDNIAITFDDGYKDNYLNAYPILRRYELPATIFLVSKLVGANEEMLNPDEVKMMGRGGIHFGSHTASHKVLTEIDINTAVEEILDSKQDVEKLLEDEIQFFAYPRGKRRHFNSMIEDLVRKSGYKAAFTTENGEIDSRSDLFALRRIGIRECPLFVFKTRVSGIFENKPVCSVRRLLRLT